MIAFYGFLVLGTLAYWIDEEQLYKWIEAYKGAECVDKEGQKVLDQASIMASYLSLAFNIMLAAIYLEVIVFFVMHCGCFDAMRFKKKTLGDELEVEDRGATSSAGNRSMTKVVPEP